MSEKPIRRVSRGRRLTAEEAAKYRRIREQVEAEKPEMTARIRREIAEARRLAEVFQELKKIREAQGLTLAEVQDRTGIDRSTLSKLETGERENYTLETILRYADAVGKQVLVTLADG